MPNGRRSGSGCTGQIKETKILRDPAREFGEALPRSHSFPVSINAIWIAIQPFAEWEISRMRIGETAE